VAALLQPLEVKVRLAVLVALHMKELRVNVVTQIGSVVTLQEALLIVT
jgi:hypothetical protein